MKEEQFTQILRAINDVRDDVKEFKNEMNRRWDENDKRWEENERRWKDNDKRWEENERRWKDNDKRWEETEKKLISIQKNVDKVNATVERRFHDTLDVFDSYENSVEELYQDNRQKIIDLQKRLKIVNA